MKILIGTPIHICKNYAMERWLENVSKVQAKTPADLLMIDNSPGPDYVERVKSYCVKYGIENYEIEHLELDSQKLSSDMRINVAQETLRRKILTNDYDAWFSWESDQLIPANTLDELMRLMDMGNYAMALSNCWARYDDSQLMTDMGCTLIKRVCLERACFLPERNGSISLNESDRYRSTFKQRVLMAGGNYIEIFGIITPIYHLDK